jgi:hypothetical protein
MEMTMLSGARIDTHPADGVTHVLRDLAVVLPRMVVTCMVVTCMAMVVTVLRGGRPGLRNGLPRAAARVVG